MVNLHLSKIFIPRWWNCKLFLFSSLCFYTFSKLAEMSTYYFLQSEKQSFKNLKGARGWLSRSSVPLDLSSGLDSRVVNSSLALGSVPGMKPTHT